MQQIPSISDGTLVDPEMAAAVKEKEKQEKRERKERKRREREARRELRHRDKERKRLLQQQQQQQQIAAMEEGEKQSSDTEDEMLFRVSLTGDIKGGRGRVESHCLLMQHGLSIFCVAKGA